jgi:cysteine-rich repeat protein
LCGNGVVDFGEECDDGNGTAGDGCTDCVVDRGWVCTGNVCSQICGNGVRDDEEECDDGNNVPGDGCSNCKVDKDYICLGGSSNS